MIIHGTYNGTDGYYKVDLGKKDDSNIFQFYDILRNYEYAVTINSVTSVGAANPSLAIAGPPFNNLSAAIETLNIRGLSDGVNKIEVSGTSFVVVKQYTPQDPLVILYQYTENITSGSGTVKNDVPDIKGLKDGAVIDGTPQTTEVTIDGKKWMQISIATKVPTKEQQRQSFTITDSNGLGRTVTLVSHVPYDMSNIQVFNGLENERPNREPQNILATQGAPLTIFFDLPDGLPESIFPLEFQLESNRQNIENSKEGTLVVTTGTSLFEKDSDGNDIERPRISYIKTVSYNEYMYIADTENKVDPTTSPVNKNHTVRCRFVTNVALSSLELPAGQNWTKTTVRIYNPYFDQGENYSKAETVFYRGDYTGN